MEPRNIAPTARAAVFAAVCVLLAVVAHRSMSMAGIPVAALVFGTVAVFCFARIASALGERGLGSITLLVGGSQLGLHLLFQLVQAPSGHVAASAMSDMPSMPDMAEVSTPAHPSMLGATSGMTIAHAVAALVTAWWLRRGEAALFAVVEHAGAVLGATWRMVAEWVAGVRPIGATSAAVSTDRFDGTRLPAARALLFTVIRRGPPPASAR